LEQLAIAAVRFLFELIDGNEPQLSGIDAVAQAARFTRPVREYVAQMAVTSPRTNLGSDHVMAGIALFKNVLLLDGLRKAWPPTATIELVQRSE
jgi:hypothetical protein